MQKQQNNTYNQTKKENVIARRASPDVAISRIFRRLNWCFLLFTGLPRQCAHWLAMTWYLLEDAPFYTSQNFFKIANPTLPLFSGWNWQPKMLPFSTAAVMGMP